MTFPDDRPAANRSGSATSVVVVGGSAGAVRPLLQVAEGLREGAGAAALVVLHRTANGQHMLPAILNRHSVYQAAQPSDGDPLQPDFIYTGPPGRHLEVDAGSLRLNRGPKVNGHRPSIDVLFKSAAAAYGPAVLAVILSGTLDDGASGLLAVRRAGGVAMVQDPEEAEFSEMPRAAIARAGPVLIKTAGEIGASLAERLAEGWPGGETRHRGAPGPDDMGEGPLDADDEAGKLVGVTWRQQRRKEFAERQVATMRSLLLKTEGD